MGSAGDGDEIGHLPEASFFLHAFDLIDLSFHGVYEVEGGLHDLFAALGCSSHAVGECADDGHAINVGVGRDGREVTALKCVDVALLDDIGQLEGYLCGEWG